MLDVRRIKMMLVLGIVQLVFLIPSLSYAKDCSEYNNLSALQKNRLEFSYHQGAEYDKGYTLASIALVESGAGLWRLNMDSKDIGLYQINIDTLAKTLGVTNHYKRIEIVQKVMYDDILGASVALSVLNYFEKHHKSDWRKMVASYNAGFNVKAGEKYAEKVAKKLVMLKQCMVL